MADAPTPETPAGEETSPAAEVPPVETPDLGDAGKRALEEERKARREAERKLKSFESELEKLRKQNMSEQERAVAEAKAQGRQEAMATSNERLLRSEIRAAAANKLADPADAPALLGDLSRFLAEDGEIDPKAVSSAIDGLVKAKPYLAGSGRPAPLPGGGAKPSTPSSGPADDFAEFLNSKLSRRSL